MGLKFQAPVASRLQGCPGGLGRSENHLSLLGKLSGPRQTLKPVHSQGPGGPIATAIIYVQISGH